jgi:hypothetical protein
MRTYIRRPVKEFVSLRPYGICALPPDRVNDVEHHAAPKVLREPVLPILP